MRHATLYLSGYTSPLQLRIPVPEGRTLAVVQTLVA